MVSLWPFLWDSTVCSHPKGTEGALCPSSRSSFLPSIAALFPLILQPSQSQYQGSRELLPWAEEKPAVACPGRGKGFHPAAAAGVSGWPVLSFPTQGELSVPCCLLTICNRCKYLLLINSLKELQSCVCVEALCWRGWVCCLQLSCCSAKVTPPPSGSSCGVLGEPWM